MHKNTFITQEAEKKINLKQFMLEKAIVLPEKSLEFFIKKKNKEEAIYIYDVGFQTPTTILPVNNHINKTGLNPFVNCGKQKIIFYDITNIYEQQKKGHIVECFGNHTPQKNNAQYIQAHFLCLHTIAAHCGGFKKIFAYIID